MYHCHTFDSVIGFGYVYLSEKKIAIIECHLFIEGPETMTQV